MAHTQRQTVDLSAYPDLVVIYLGMRVRTWRGLGTLLSFGPKISAAVDSKPEGLLLHESLLYSLFPIHTGMRQYWRDFQSLEKTGRGACRTSNGGRTFCRIPEALAFGMKRISCAAEWRPSTMTWGSYSALAVSLRLAWPTVPCSARGNVSAYRATPRFPAPYKKRYPESIRESLVTKRFDRVQIGCPYRRKHAAYYADQRQNGHCDQQDVGRHHQPDITRVRMLGHRAVQRQRSNRKRNQVRQQNPQHAPHRGNHHRLCQELEHDVFLARPERFFHADLACPLGDRHQHDVHQPDAADPESDRSDESQEDLQSHGDDIELGELFLCVEDEDRALVVCLEIVRRGQRFANRAGHLLVIHALVV